LEKWEGVALNLERTTYFLYYDTSPPTSASPLPLQVTTDKARILNRGRRWKELIFLFSDPSS
jgi:hypothetical protein